MIESGCLVINTSNNNPTNQDTLAFTQRKLVENEVDRLHLPDLDVVPPERRGRRLQQRQLVLLGLAEDGVQVRQPGSHLIQIFLFMINKSTNSYVLCNVCVLTPAIISVRSSLEAGQG